jgi:hypothetical protein
MTNTDGGTELLRALLTAAQRHYGPQPTPTAPRPGTYTLPSGYSLEITEDLTVRTPNQPPAPLHPLPNGRYRVAALDCELAFDGDTVELHQDNTAVHLSGG